MDIEFHYYMTYLIAVRAGFGHGDATTIAWASQGVDDNHVPISVNKGSPLAYENLLSQTMDITRPHHDTRIYPIFHFIPGDPHALTAQRADHRTSLWNTTPNSALANQMIDAALASRDVYRIGASSHAYCDTWAHQNFLGIEDDFNVVPIEHGDDSITLDFLNSIAKIGHGPAKHKPDWPGLTWVDGRLAMPISRVVNKNRFLDAAKHLFEKLYRFNHEHVDPVDLAQEQAGLIADLAADIGAPDNANAQVAQRLARYRKRAETAPYGGTAMIDYTKDAWSNAALNQPQGNVFDWLHEAVVQGAGDYGDLLREGRRVECAWRDPGHYKDTAWYKFQEAIKTHLNECWTILLRTIPDANHQAS